MGRSPSLPRDFTVYTVTLPVLRVFHCERCRIQTRDHGLSIVWSATNEPPHLNYQDRTESLEMTTTNLIKSRNSIVEPEYSIDSVGYSIEISFYAGARLVSSCEQALNNRLQSVLK